MYYSARMGLLPDSRRRLLRLTVSMPLFACFLCVFILFRQTCVCTVSKYIEPFFSSPSNTMSLSWSNLLVPPSPITMDGRVLVKRSSSWQTAIGCVPINPRLAASIRYVLTYVDKSMYIVPGVVTEAGCEAVVTAQLGKNSAGSCGFGAWDGMWYHDSTATNWDAGLICRSGDEIKLTLHHHDQLIVEITRMSAGSPRNVLKVVKQMPTSMPRPLYWGISLYSADTIVTIVE